MDDGQTLRSMVRDDAYVVERVLSDGPSGRTEIVTLDGEGPLVRKRIPLAIANASAWAVAMEANEPLLPRIESLYRMPDVLVVVYDYVPGCSLSDVVEQSGRLSPSRAVAAIADVCRAVGALHERGVVHRDITPGNVILSDDGAHLVDLGIARQRIEGRQRDTTTLGTWGFAAPEQYGFAQTDARSDVYALGRLLGFMLTGERPDSESYERRLSDTTLVPKELADVVYVATSFEPSVRYQSAAGLATAAENALAGGRFTLDDEHWAQDERSGVQANSHEVAKSGGVADNWSQPSPSERRVPDSKSQPSTDDMAMRDGAPATRRFSLVDGSREPTQDWHGVAAAQGVWATGKYDTTPSMPASSARKSRGFSNAPLYQRIAAIACWVALALMASVVVFTAFSAIATGKPPWKAAQYGMGVTTMLACLAVAFEVYHAITRTGAHASQVRPLLYLLGNVATIVALYVISLFVCALALPA